MTVLRICVNFVTLDDIRFLISLTPVLTLLFISDTLALCAELRADVALLMSRPSFCTCEFKILGLVAAWLALHTPAKI